MYWEKCLQHPLFFAIHIVIVLKVEIFLLSLDDILARNCCVYLEKLKTNLRLLCSGEIKTILENYPKCGEGIYDLYMIYMNFSRLSYMS